MSNKIEKANPLRQALQDYLRKNKMKQQTLSDYLGVDVRTLRRWMSGETVVVDIRELKRIANLLQILPEALGVVGSLSMTPTSDQIGSRIDHTWMLVRSARYLEANAHVEILLRDIRNPLNTEDMALLQKLAHVHHLAGFVKSQTTRASQIAIPSAHYQEMERIARIMNDHTLLHIALTYQGDMLQRGGKVQEAITYLEAARDTTQQVDVVTKGNGIQLLGRAYFKAHRFGDFERAMREAETFASLSQVERPDSARGQFNMGTVYEEYARSLGLLGQLGTALTYLEKAEAVFHQWNIQRRDLLIKTAKAMILVYGGEVRAGVDVAIECALLCKEHGNVRLLDRVYGLQHYLDHLSREIGNAGSMLRDALDGIIEY